MRLIVMGNGPFAVPMLERLLDSPHQVLAVVVRPDRSRSSRRPVPQPMRSAAQRRQVPVFDPPDINQGDTVAWLRHFDADALVVCDFGQILSQECLAAARLGGINLHGSLLPKYRGAAPVAWAIYRGETVTGVSVIHMTPKMDAGPIIESAETEIGPDETAGELESRLAVLGADAVLRAVEKLENWDGTTPLGVLQNAAQTTSAPRLKKEQAHINWSRDARQIAHQVRAFQPWPGSYTLLQRESKPPIRVILLRATAASDQRPAPQDRASMNAGQTAAGNVVDTSGGILRVATGRGILEIHQVQPEGRRPMSAAEFLRGYPLAPGTRLL